MNQFAPLTKPNLKQPLKPFSTRIEKSMEAKNQSCTSKTGYYPILSRRKISRITILTLYFYAVSSVDENHSPPSLLHKKVRSPSSIPNISHICSFVFHSMHQSRISDNLGNTLVNHLVLFLLRLPISITPSQIKKSLIIGSISINLFFNCVYV